MSFSLSMIKEMRLVATKGSNSLFEREFNRLAVGDCSEGPVRGFKWQGGVTYAVNGTTRIPINKILQSGNSGWAGKYLKYLTREVTALNGEDSEFLGSGLALIGQVEILKHFRPQTFTMFLTLSSKRKKLAEEFKSAGSIVEMLKIGRCVISHHMDLCLSIGFKKFMEDVKNVF